MTVVVTRSPAKRIVSRYVAGATLREIAKLEGLSHETIRRQLKAAGVKLRQRRMFPGGGVGVELLADLATQFPKGASVPELMEWLGIDRRKALATITSLLKHGYVAIVLRADP